jgi:hypothetical protein
VSSEITLPPRVRQLLGTIDSFEKLHVVRLLAEHRGEAWSLARIADELRLSADEATAAAQRLIDADLLVRTGPDVGYAPGATEVGEAVEQLLQLYRDETLVVVRAITAQAMENIRNSAAHTFADAFVVRRSKPREPDNG